MHYQIKRTVSMANERRQSTIRSMITGNLVGTQTLKAKTISSK